MTGRTKIAALVLLLIAAILCTSCILDEKVIEVILRNSTCLDFQEYDEDETFSTPDTIDMADEIGETLAENGMSRGDIVTASLISCTYEVTDLTPPVGHADWVISGAITVERIDKARAATTLVEYDTQSIVGAMGLTDPIVADLTPAGVDLLNEALADFIAGDDPVIVVKTENGNVDPDPTPSDPIDFDWQACLNFYLQFDETLDLIDLFPPSE